MKYYDITDLEVRTTGLMKGIQESWMPSRLHRHGEVEINVLEKGSVDYIFGGTRKVVKEGEIALFWAAIPHQIIQCEEPTILHWLNIPFNIFLQWQFPHSLTQKVVSGTFISGSLEIEDQPILILFKQWGKDLNKSSPEYQTLVLLEVEAFLYRFALASLPIEGDTGQEEIQKKSLPGKMSKAEQMANFIVEYYTKPIHVQEVADAVQLNPSYAMNLFRQYFGISIFDYITQHRIAHAQRLLITTNDTILEIALASGFGSMSNFYITYKHACKLSPKAYRIAYSLTKKQMYNVHFRQGDG